MSHIHLTLNNDQVGNVFVTATEGGRCQFSQKLPPIKTTEKIKQVVKIIFYGLLYLISFKKWSRTGEYYQKSLAVLINRPLEAFGELSEFLKTQTVSTGTLKGKEAVHAWIKQQKEIFIHTAVSSQGVLLEYADTSIRSDREFILRIMELVKQSAGVENAAKILKYVTDSLKQDEHFVRSVVDQTSLSALMYAGENLLNNANFMLEVFKIIKNPELFDYLGSQLKTDQQFILLVLQAAETAELRTQIMDKLEDSLQQSESFLSLLASHGLYNTAYAYASTELRQNRDFMLKLVKFSQGTLFSRCPQALQEDRIFILDALCALTVKNETGVIVQSNYDFLQFIPSSLLSERAFVSEALKRTENYSLLLYANPQFLETQDNFEAIYQAADTPDSFKSHGGKRATEFYSHENLILRLCEQGDYGILCAAPQTLRLNKDFILQVIEASPVNVFQSTIDPTFLTKEFILEILTSERMLGVIPYLPTHLKKDVDLFRQAISRMGMKALEDADDSVKNDADFMCELIKQDYDFNLSPPLATNLSFGLRMLREMGSSAIKYFSLLRMHQEFMRVHEELCDQERQAKRAARQRHNNSKVPVREPSQRPSANDEASEPETAGTLT